MSLVANDVCVLSVVIPRLAFTVILLRFQQMLGAISCHCGSKHFVKYIIYDKFPSIQHVFVIVCAVYMSVYLAFGSLYVETVVSVSRKVWNVETDTISEWTY
jgi:hypothetical protein